MAGTVDQIQRCYSGIVTRSDTLWLNPALPDDLQNLCLKVRYRGYFLQIEIYCEHVEVTALRAREYPIRIGYLDKVMELKGHDTLEFSLKK
jgi:alpha,alpha-trehalase